MQSKRRHSMIPIQFYFPHHVLFQYFRTESFQINETVLPYVAILFLIDAINSLTSRGNLMMNPIFERLSSRAIQNIPNMIGYL